MQIDGKFSTHGRGVAQRAQLVELAVLSISIRVTVRSLPDAQQTGMYPETGFEEVGQIGKGKSARLATKSWMLARLSLLNLVKLPQEDFWPGIASGLPVIQPESSPALLKNSILHRTAKI